MIDLDLATGGTAVSHGFSTWSDYIAVNASELPPTTTVFVATDGSVASPTNYTDSIEGDQTTIVANRQAKLDGLQEVGSGGLDDGENPAGNGVTAQTDPASLWTDGYPTYISVLLSDSATGHIGIDQR
jgi:hypothetical protein